VHAPRRLHRPARARTRRSQRSHRTSAAAKSKGERLALREAQRRAFGAPHAAQKRGHAPANVLARSQAKRAAAACGACSRTMVPDGAATAARGELKRAFAALRRQVTKQEGRVSSKRRSPALRSLSRTAGCGSR
jgi:hypothetical protein